MAAADILTSELNNIGNMLAAIAALGTAAYGLVDTTKVIPGGGISRAGFGYIKKALSPFAPALIAAGGKDWDQTLLAHWINGRSKEDQKAIAKALIHLGLSPGNAAQLAVFGRVDPLELQTVVTNLSNGVALTTPNINVLGRFDSMIDATLDGAYERADQVYRNASKALAALFAILLALAGGALIAASMSMGVVPPYFIFTKEGALAILVGVVAVPLAPIAKDISTSLVAAVNAIKATRS
jgi:hypothetical protein